MEDFTLLADECRHKEKHSEEFFDDVLEDITEYERYCIDHPAYKNEKAKQGIKIIQMAYQHCVQTGEFL